MSWELILKVMKLFGLGNDFSSLISACLTSVTYSIFLNGSPYGKIKPSRGLREGGKLSLYLFIIGVEVLSRLLMRDETLQSSMVSNFKKFMKNFG